MDWRHIILAVAIVCQTIGITFYIVGMKKGHTKPNLISWLFWAIWPIIGSAAAFSKGITWGTVPVIVAGLNPLLVVIAALILRQSRWKLRPFDYFCGLLSLLAIALWYITGEANIAIVISLLGDVTASAPTLKKAFKQPGSESYFTYATGLFSAIVSFLFFTHWNFAEIAYPIYLVIADSTILFLLLVKPRLGVNKPKALKAKK